MPKFRDVSTLREFMLHIFLLVFAVGFAIGDGSGLPFIFIIFWALVGSWRMLIIPCMVRAFDAIDLYFNVILMNIRCADLYTSMIASPLKFS